MRWRRVARSRATKPSRISSRIRWDALCWLTPISLPSSPEDRFTYSFMPPRSAIAFSVSTWYGFTARRERPLRICLFPGSETLGHQVVPRPEEDARDARGAQAIEERLVVRHDDGPVRGAQIEERVIGGTGCLDDPIPCGEPQSRFRGPIPFGQEFQFGPPGPRERDVGLSHQAGEFRFQGHAELERHQERGRVEKDDSRRYLPSSLWSETVPS